MKCIYCGNENADDAKYCNKCGEDLTAVKRKCPRCGTENEKDSQFCFKCGFDFIPKKKKGKGFLIAIVVVVIAAAGAGLFSYQQQKIKQQQLEQQKIEQQKIEAEQKRQELISLYETKAGELYTAINAASSNFNTISYMFGLSTEMNTGFLGPSFYTDYVKGLCASELSEEKERKSDIDEINSELNAIECNEIEIENLKKASDRLYLSYCDRYNLVIEMNFSINNFSMLNTESEKDFGEKLEKTKEIIEELGIHLDKTSDDEGEEL